jgi:hypothetical protein
MAGRVWTGRQNGQFQTKWVMQRKDPVDSYRFGTTGQKTVTTYISTWAKNAPRGMTEMALPTDGDVAGNYAEDQDRCTCKGPY